MESKRKGPIAWMAGHTVAANLLMLFFLVAGLLIALQMQQEVFPEVELDIVRVVVPYPGASPEEIEQGVILSIEDEVRALDGVKRVSSVAREGQGTVSVELLRGQNGNEALQEVKNAVDSIQSFPEEAERPLVSLLQPRRQVISLVLYGDLSRRTLRVLAERIRDQLSQQEGITLVDLEAAPLIEISIEVPQEKLRSLHLTLDEMAALVHDSSVEVPAGAVKTPTGEVLLRTQERRDYASEFEEIPIVSDAEGTKVLLGDIATVREQFEESDQEAFFNGKPAIKIDIFRVGGEKPLQVVAAVNRYLDTLRPTLPSGVSVAIWDDHTELFHNRIDLLMRNARIGLLLVLLLLALFMEPRLAFWVTLGIPISIVGSFLFIPFTGATLNMVSLFAFILTLGIIVDDAVVVGENIFQKRELGLPRLDAAISGCCEISTPVVFAILTNIAAFIPLLFVPGSTGKIFLQIPAVVIAVFVVSLIESLYILPAHLSTSHRPSRWYALLKQPTRRFNQGLRRLIDGPYLRFLLLALHYRYVTIVAACSLLVVAVAIVMSGFVPLSYLPRVESDLVTAQVTLPFGTPISEARRVQEQLVNAAERVIASEGGDITQGIYTQIGTPIASRGPASDAATVGFGSHIVGAQVSLLPADQRDISGIAFANAWRHEVGEIVGIETINFDAQIASGEGEAINIELSHSSIEALQEAASELGRAITLYGGISDVNDGVALGKPQISLQVKPEARSLGITAQELARQVRGAFYGVEALRQQRERNEIKVMLRLPKEERQTIYTVEEMILLGPNGGEIPLSEAAWINEGRAYTYIKRADGRRVLAVTADVDEAVANANTIIADLQVATLPHLIDKYPGLSYTLQGELKAQRESMDALKVGFIIALVAIYAMLAIPFRSYFQPLIVMVSIPFGIVGAVVGHLLLGYAISIISMFGIIALAGVVVNGALVFVVTANRNTSDQPIDRVVAACQTRFRPIILTALTTFFGLAPMIFETSMQARFLIPMAISLGFGVLFATVIILVIVPAIYLALDDCRRFFVKMSNRNP